MKCRPRDAGPAVRRRPRSVTQENMDDQRKQVHERCAEALASIAAGACSDCSEDCHTWASARHRFSVHQLRRMFIPNEPLARAARAGGCARGHPRGPPSVLSSRGHSISALSRADAPSPGFCGSTFWLKDLEMNISPAKGVRPRSQWRRLHPGYLDLIVALGTNDYVRKRTEDGRWLKN